MQRAMVGLYRANVSRPGFADFGYGISSNDKRCRVMITNAENFQASETTTYGTYAETKPNRSCAH